MKKIFVIFTLTFVSLVLFADNRDDEACNFARKVGSVDVWKNYLETYPNGTCAFEAESVLKMNKQKTPKEMQGNNPQDANACAMARQKNKLEIWKIYLETYPNGICAFEAKTAISDLEHLSASVSATDKEESCDVANRTFPCKDSATGLTWSKRTPNEMNWMNAINYCSDLKEGGYDDWRLPKVDELRTIIKDCPKTMSYGGCKVSERNDCLSDNCWKPEGSCFCSNGGKYSKLGDYKIRLWSSSATSNNSNIIWYVNLSEANIYYHSKSNSHHVRCVR